MHGDGGEQRIWVQIDVTDTVVIWLKGTTYMVGISGVLTNNQ